MTGLTTSVGKNFHNMRQSIEMNSLLVALSCTFFKVVSRILDLTGSTADIRRLGRRLGGSNLITFVGCSKFMARVFFSDILIDWLFVFKSISTNSSVLEAQRPSPASTPCFSLHTIGVV